jgi:hypothetical protein
MFERMSLNLQRVGEEWYGELKVRVRSGWHLRTEVLNVPLIGGDSAAAQAHFASILRAAGFQVNPEWGLPLPSQPPDPASQALPVPAAPLDRGTDDLPIAQDSDQVPAH